MKLRHAAALALFFALVASLMGACMRAASSPPPPALQPEAPTTTTEFNCIRTVTGEEIGVCASPNHETAGCADLKDPTDRLNCEQSEQQVEKSKEATKKANAEEEKLIEKDNADEASEHRREVQREKKAARNAQRAAAKAAAQQAASEQAAAKAAATQQAASERALDAHAGSDCINTFSRYELDVHGSLGWLQTFEFTSQRCTVQHRILAYLGQFPPAERPEQFDRLLDAASRH